MLYTSFNEKIQDDWHDDETCIKADDIRKVKTEVMEWLEDVEEGRYYVEEPLENQVDTKEIRDTLNPERELEILDCEEVGIEADPLYENLDSQSHRDEELLKTSKWCKTIELMTGEKLKKEIQNLYRFKEVLQTLDLNMLEIQ